MRYSNVLFVCACTPQGSGKEEGNGAAASMKSVDMDARDTNRGPVQIGASARLGTFIYTTKASLLFDTFPRQILSPTSASILDNATDTVLGQYHLGIMGHGKRVQYYMGSSFYYHCQRRCLSMFIRPGYSLADTKLLLASVC